MTDREHPDGPHEPEEELFASRLRRTAALGRLAAGEAARYAATSAANLRRSPEDAADALGRQQVETARRMVQVLGSMKGVAMKVGQMLSVVDLEAVPPAYREDVRAELARLRDAAPAVAFPQMRRAIERDYGAPQAEIFETFDETPIAAASIGQVYRATIEGGRAVAVKVQYPGIDAAVRADLQNLVPLLRVARQLMPGIDVEATAREVRERIHEELDYELEADNTRAVARAHRGHPFIVIPEVHAELCRPRVLVMDLLEGVGHDAIARMDQASRDRVAEMIFRFYFGCMYRHRAFSGDPHPGNSILLPDGRMGFIDFGLFKRISVEASELELEIHRLGVEGRGAQMVERMAAAGMLADPAATAPDALLDEFRAYTWWFTTDEVVELDPTLATRIVLDFSDPTGRHFRDIRHQRLPPEHIFGRRLEMMTLAVISGLRARGNWHRIAREWLYGDPPATELGRAEALYYAGR